MAKYLAVDLGATSGRVIAGSLDCIEELYRFDSPSVQILGSFYWDSMAIFREILNGLKIGFDKYGDEIRSIGIDAWGVDYCLLDKTGSLVSPVYHYRDGRTDGMIDEISAIFGGKMNLYSRNGIAFQPFNTICQLYAHKKYNPESFAAACTYLSFPDTLNYWLTGVKACELTHASTTQLLDPRTKQWCWDIIDKLGFPERLFGTVVPSGTVIGSLTKDLQSMLGASDNVKVVAVGAHDTASAVAAVPAKAGEDYLYISSGTWSLLGVELSEPVLTKAALDSGFTNELSFNGNVRFLENIMGMWIQGECVRYWKSKGQDISWKILDEETISDTSYNCWIDPMDPRFLKANTYDNLMTDRICAYCRETGQKVPETRAQYMRAIYRGLAKAYARAIENLSNVTGKKYDSLYIIGGGCKNEILDKWTAEETGLKVTAGPVEATALGNLLVQSLACGDISSLDEGRARIAASQKVKCF